MSDISHDAIRNLLNFLDGDTTELDKGENMNKPVKDSSTLTIHKHENKSKSRGSWNTRQKNLMLQFFKSHIKNKTSPKKGECLQFQQNNMELFKEKTWVQIKVFVYNTYRNNQ